MIIRYKAFDVLREFVADIDAVGPEKLGEHEDSPHYWPDLLITYHKARTVLRQHRETKRDLAREEEEELSAQTSEEIINP